MRRICWLLAAALAWALAPLVALAQEPVAVSAFSGPGAADARAVVVGAVEGDARARLVESESGARLVIGGVVAGRGVRRRIVLTARDASGHAVGTERARLRGAAGRRALTAATTSLLDTALAALPPEQIVARAEDAAPPPTSRHDTPAPAPSTGSPEPRSSAWGDDPATLTIALSGALRSREASFTLVDGTTRGYGASPYFELGGRLELRPLAHEQSYARGLYATLDASGAIGLSSHRADGSSVSTTFYRLAASVGYLVPIASALELGAGVGGGWDAFQLANNQTMPTVEYPYLRVAIRARVRVLGELLVLGAEAGYRALFGRDGLSSAFGARGDSFGWDVAGAISGTLDFGLFYALEAGYAQYVHAFDGTGGFIAQATGGTDGGYRFTLLAGYALR